MPSVQKPAVRILPAEMNDATVKATLEKETQNTVTAEELKPGQPRFTAHGVDSQQMTKLYHGRSAPYAFVDSPEIYTKDDIQHCRKGSKTVTGPDGSSKDQCVGGFKTAQVKETTLSCVYKNEDDGKHYRVTHASKFFTAPFHKAGTPMMQQKVCGGHVLVSKNEGGFSTWSPRQTDQSGKPLYLNPEHILEVKPLSPEELAKLKLK